MSIGLATELIISGRKGGGTFNFRGDELPAAFGGYIVGGKVPGLVIELHGNLIEQVEVVAKWTDRNLSSHYGSWADDGRLYIDAVDLVMNRDEAIALGRQRGEMAIWDFAAGEEIRL